MSDGPNTRRPQTTLPRAPMHHRRTVGPAIPCRGASPQYPIPFHQTISLCPATNPVAIPAIEIDATAGPELHTAPPSSTVRSSRPTKRRLDRNDPLRQATAIAAALCSVPVLPWHSEPDSKMSPRLQMLTFGDREQRICSGSVCICRLRHGESGLSPIAASRSRFLTCSPGVASRI